MSNIERGPESVASIGDSAEFSYTDVSFRDLVSSESE
jgi:hypothetical protein